MSSKQNKIIDPGFFRLLADMWGPLGESALFPLSKSSDFRYSSLLFRRLGFLGFEIDRTKKEEICSFLNEFLSAVKYKSNKRVVTEWKDLFLDLSLTDFFLSLEKSIDLSSDWSLVELFYEIFWPEIFFLNSEFFEFSYFEKWVQIFVNKIVRKHRENLVKSDKKLNFWFSKSFLKNPDQASSLFSFSKGDLVRKNEKKLIGYVFFSSLLWWVDFKNPKDKSDGITIFRDCANQIIRISNELGKRFGIIVAFLIMFFGPVVTLQKLVYLSSVPDSEKKRLLLNHLENELGARFSPSFARWLTLRIFYFLSVSSEIFKSPIVIKPISGFGLIRAGLSNPRNFILLNPIAVLFKKNRLNTLGQKLCKPYSWFITIISQFIAGLYFSAAANHSLFKINCQFIKNFSLEENERFEDRLQAALANFSDGYFVQSSEESRNLFASLKFNRKQVISKTAPLLSSDILIKVISRLTSFSLTRGFSEIAVSCLTSSSVKKLSRFVFLGEKAFMDNYETPEIINPISTAFNSFTYSLSVSMFTSLARFPSDLFSITFGKYFSRGKVWDNKSKNLVDSFTLTASYPSRGKTDAELNRFITGNIYSFRTIFWNVFKVNILDKLLDFSFPVKRRLIKGVLAEQLFDPASFFLEKNSSIKVEFAMTNFIFSDFVGSTLEFRFIDFGHNLPFLLDSWSDYPAANSWSPLSSDHGLLERDLTVSFPMTILGEKIVSVELLEGILSKKLSLLVDGVTLLPLVEKSKYNLEGKELVTVGLRFVYSRTRLDSSLLKQKIDLWLEHLSG